MDFYTSLLSFLAGVTVRSLVLVAAAAAAILIFRVTASAARHAVWTMTVTGMLLLAALGPAMPPIALRVWRAPAAATVLRSADAPPPRPPAGIAALPAVAPPISPVRASVTWQQIAVLLYAAVTLFFLARLGFGYLFTIRLVRASRRLEGDWADDVYESSWISVPLTVGWLRPKILLPAGWDQWSRPKLDAVMAHERTHIARADWAISILSGVNRCLFWFNPAAWWLERTLASLAEQACDDAALLLVESGHYAQALLEMAAAVKTGQGRLIWEAMAMAKAAEVRKRIDRILDETRQIPRALTRSRWVALVAVSLPLIYVTSVVQLAAQEPTTPAAMAEFLKGKRRFSDADVRTMEQYLKTNPTDLDVRSQLVTFYFATDTGRTERFGHIQWVVANAPESDTAAYISRGFSPRANSLNDPAEYARIAAQWRQQAAAHPKDAAVLSNAGQFFAQPGGELEDAERYFVAARAIDPRTTALNRLAELYSQAILGATGDSGYAKVDASFANKVKHQLENSQDLLLVGMTGSRLANAARRPTAEAPLRPGETNLNDHPLLLDAIDLGGRLLARTGQQGVLGALASPAVQQAIANNPNAVVRMGAQTVPGQIASPAQINAPQAPTPVSKVDPVYPPLARQARIQGVVRMSVTIAADGSVDSMYVVSGHPLLVPVTMEALRQWRFPAGNPGTYTLGLPFTLPDAPALTPHSPQAGVTGGVQGGVPGGVQGGVPNGVPERIKVGGNVQAARIKEKVDAAYPALARQAGISGDVSLEVTIGKDGTVEAAKPIAGHPILVNAAREAVLQWTYVPTTLNGVPVTVITSVTVPFKLEQ